MSARRGLICLAGALVATAVLVAAAPSMPAPPLAGPGELEDWWTSNGTAVATFALIRVVGLALSGYVAALGLVGTIAAATKWAWADALLARCATPRFRRLLVGGGLVASLSVSTVGAARAPTVFDLVDLGPAGTDFQIHDLGPAGTDFQIHDLGPAGTGSRSIDIEPTANSRPEADVAVPAATTTAEAELESWLVAHGDHLWSIAAETMADRGEDQREASVAAYWLRLIEENRDVLGQNPDLIHPGQVIRLPD